MPTSCRPSPCSSRSESPDVEGIIRLAVYQSAAIAPRLRDIVGDAYIAETYDDRQALQLAIHTRPLDALMLDPTSCMDDPAVCVLIARYNSLPLILYPALTTHSMRAFLTVSQVRSSFLVLRGIEDSADRLRHFLRSLPPADLNRAILASLRASISILPPKLATAITLHFIQAETRRSVEWLAATSGLTRRSVDRWIRKVGLSSTRLLTLGPVLTRAFTWLRDPGYTARDVAAKIGVSSPHTLASEFEAILQVGSLAAVRNLTPTSFIDAMTSVLLADQRQE